MIAVVSDTTASSRALTPECLKDHLLFSNLESSKSTLTRPVLKTIVPEHTVRQKPSQRQHWWVDCGRQERASSRLSWLQEGLKKISVTFRA